MSVVVADAAFGGLSVSRLGDHVCWASVASVLLCFLMLATGQPHTVLFQGMPSPGRDARLSHSLVHNWCCPLHTYCSSTHKFSALDQG